MATHAHTTEQRDQLNRRFLLAWFGATAAATSVATAGPALAGASPDAELLALCDEWQAVNAEFDAIVEATGDDPPESAAVGARMTALEKRIVLTPSRTVQGVAAKARLAQTIRENAWAEGIAWMVCEEVQALVNGRLA
jgi:hypothetical protein